MESLVKDLQKVVVVGSWGVSHVEFDHKALAVISQNLVASSVVHILAHVQQTRLSYRLIVDEDVREGAVLGVEVRELRHTLGRFHVGAGKSAHLVFLKDRIVIVEAL